MNKDVVQLTRVPDSGSQALIAGTSSKQASDILLGLLLDVVRRHQPEIEPILKGGGNISGFTPELMSRALQAQGLWFQLLSIAEQNAAMRRRRHTAVASKTRPRADRSTVPRAARPLTQKSAARIGPQAPLPWSSRIRSGSAPR